MGASNLWGRRGPGKGAASLRGVSRGPALSVAQSTGPYPPVPSRACPLASQLRYIVLVGLGVPGKRPTLDPLPTGSNPIKQKTDSLTSGNPMGESALLTTWVSKETL